MGNRKVERIIAIERETPLAVMTSGTCRHFFDRNGVRYSHILDVRTGRPAFRFAHTICWSRSRIQQRGLWV